MDASNADATLSVLTSNRDSKGKEVRKCLITCEKPVTTAGHRFCSHIVLTLGLFRDREYGDTRVVLVKLILFLFSFSGAETITEKMTDFLSNKKKKEYAAKQILAFI